MRIVFYLPVITPWWFDNVVGPLIRLLADTLDVHVLAPVPWQGTGIGPRELSACADLAQVHWHILDGDSHPTLRTAPVDRADIIAFVTALAPDYVLCRSADCETVNAFPGVVRHIMEGGAGPLELPNDWVVLQEQPLDHGLLPALDADARATLDALIAPIWAPLLDLARPSAATRDSFRHWAGLPTDRPVLAIPLEYEHEENFFAMHRVGGSPNHRLIATLNDAIDDSVFLAITDHPLNVKHTDTSALEAEIAAHGARMRLLPAAGPAGESTTMLLARDADGMVVGDSKVYALAGFFGTPILRRSRFRTGDWLNAYRDLATFQAAIKTGVAIRPDRDAARTWFAFHVANNLFNPNDPDLTASDLLARLDRPVDPARWEAGVARLRAASSLKTLEAVR